MQFENINFKIPVAVKTVIKIVISIAILILIFKKIDGKLLIQILSTANPAWIIWAILWFIISKIISAFRYKLFLKAEHIQLSNSESLSIYWLGMYYNLLLPGGISGDGYKIKILMDRFGHPFKRLFGITLLDRFSGIISLFIICLGMVPWMASLKEYSSFSIPGIIACLLLIWYGFRWFDGKLTKFIVPTSIQSFGVQIAQIIATLGLVFALGQQSNWLGYIFLFLISSVVTMIPFTIGGAGTRELTFLYGSALLSLQSEKAVAIGFLFYLISTSVSLIGIFYSFKKTKVQ